MITFAQLELDTMRQPGYVPSAARWRAVSDGVSSETRAQSIMTGETHFPNVRDQRTREKNKTTGAAARSRRAS